MWTCHTCNGKRIHYRGVPRHRAMHRDRKDGPVVMSNDRARWTYDYRDEADQ